MVTLCRGRDSGERAAALRVHPPGRTRRQRVRERRGEPVRGPLPARRARRAARRGGALSRTVALSGFAWQLGFIVGPAWAAPSWAQGPRLCGSAPPPSASSPGYGPCAQSRRCRRAGALRRSPLPVGVERVEHMRGELEDALVVVV